MTRDQTLAQLATLHERLRQQRDEALRMRGPSIVNAITLDGLKRDMAALDVAIEMLKGHGMPVESAAEIDAEARRSKRRILNKRNRSLERKFDRNIRDICGNE